MCEFVRNPADREFRRKCQVAVGLSLLVYILYSQAAQRIADRHLGILLAGIAGAAFLRS